MKLHYMFKLKYKSLSASSCFKVEYSLALISIIFERTPMSEAKSTGCMARDPSLTNVRFFN